MAEDTKPAAPAAQTNVEPKTEDLDINIQYAIVSKRKRVSDIRKGHSNYYEYVRDSFVHSYFSGDFEALKRNIATLYGNDAKIVHPSDFDREIDEEEKEVTKK